MAPKYIDEVLNRLISMEEKIESSHKKILEAIEALDKKCDRIEKLVKDKSTAPVPAPIAPAPTTTAPAPTISSAAPTTTAPAPTTTAPAPTTSIPTEPTASLSLADYQQHNALSSKGKTMFAVANLSLSPEEVEKKYKIFKKIVIEACQGGNENNSLFERTWEEFSYDEERTLRGTIEARIKKKLESFPNFVSRIFWVNAD